MKVWDVRARRSAADESDSRRSRDRALSRDRDLDRDRERLLRRDLLRLRGEGLRERPRERPEDRLRLRSRPDVPSSSVLSNLASMRAMKLSNRCNRLS